MEKYVVFRLENESYAIEVSSVQSIETVQPTTRLPYTEQFVTGLMTLRGVLVPVVDLRLYFGLDRREPTPESRVVVVSKDEKLTGLLVDSATNVIDIPDEDIDFSLSDVAGYATKTALKGIAKTDGMIIALLDVHKILDTGSEAMATYTG
ncbi:chemotaxis protein CheW [Alicyclobacillus dauci]|uniref:Chemotaxis protein CheW n=1 Tax=Alicyclobacillus dauci TaxID=1475485 RepID=A0ABY6Z4I9_9BACL|nr:chemotaxis protein CheW [Alicyclobacillus dauci]WAH37770.1 chemotaxis protein CheW [Alicyclobacillus dauci]